MIKWKKECTNVKCKKTTKLKILILKLLEFRNWTKLNWKLNWFLDRNTSTLESWLKNKIGQIHLYESTGLNSFELRTFYLFLDKASLGACNIGTFLVSTCLWITDSKILSQCLKWKKLWQQRALNDIAMYMLLNGLFFICFLRSTLAGCNGLKRWVKGNVNCNKGWWKNFRIPNLPRVSMGAK